MPVIAMTVDRDVLGLHEAGLAGRLGVEPARAEVRAAGDDEAQALGLAGVGQARDDEVGATRGGRR